LDSWYEGVLGNKKELYKKKPRHVSPGLKFKKNLLGKN
jgi:hypothetical protein